VGLGEERRTNSVVLAKKLNDAKLTLDTMIQVQLDLLSKIKPVQLCAADTQVSFSESIGPILDKDVKVSIIFKGIYEEITQTGEYNSETSVIKQLEIVADAYLLLARGLSNH